MRSTTSVVGTFQTRRDIFPESEMRFKADVTDRRSLRAIVFPLQCPHREARHDVRDPFFQWHARFVLPFSFDPVGKLGVYVAAQMAVRLPPGRGRRALRSVSSFEDREFGSMSSVSDEDVFVDGLDREAFAFEHPHQRVEYLQAALASWTSKMGTLKEIKLVEGRITAARVVREPLLDDRMLVPARSKHIRIVGFECPFPQSAVDFRIHRVDLDISKNRALVTRQYGPSASLERGVAGGLA